MGIHISQDYIFRGRRFNEQEIGLIKRITEQHRNQSRRKISKMICELLNWKQPNGNLKDMACREVLLRMNEKGLIDLPRIKPKFSKEPVKTFQQLKFNFVEPEWKVESIDNFDLITLKMVRGTEQEKLWNYLIDKYHYLGYKTPVGHFLKYLIYYGDKILGCIGFADGVLKLNLRDKWIGWDIQERERNLHLVINNNRFLILPWVKVKNLASKILSIATKEVRKDWEYYYKYSPVLVETFVDVGKFIGTCYKASNWIYLGRTIGKGRCGMNYFVHNQPKDIYVYSLCKDYIDLLRCK